MAIDPRLPNLHAPAGSGQWGAPVASFPCLSSTTEGCDRVFLAYLNALLHDCTAPRSETP